MTHTPKPLRDEAGLEEAFAHPTAVIYKHSPRCGMSLSAVYQIGRFMEAEPDVPVYLVDVVADRSLAREVESRLGVRHESPQAIVLVEGVATWDASHRGVTALALSSAVRPDR